MDFDVNVAAGDDLSCDGKINYLLIMIWKILIMITGIMVMIRKIMIRRYDTEKKDYDYDHY